MIGEPRNDIPQAPQEEQLAKPIPRRTIIKGIFLGLLGTGAAVTGVLKLGDLLGKREASQSQKEKPQAIKDLEKITKIVPFTQPVNVGVTLERISGQPVNKPFVDKTSIIYARQLDSVGPSEDLYKKSKYVTTIHDLKVDRTFLKEQNLEGTLGTLSQDTQEAIESKEWKVELTLLQVDRFSMARVIESNLEVQAAYDDFINTMQEFVEKNIQMTPNAGLDPETAAKIVAQNMSVGLKIDSTDKLYFNWGTAAWSTAGANFIFAQDPTNGELSYSTNYLSSSQNSRVVPVGEALTEKWNTCKKLLEEALKLSVELAIHQP